MCSVFHGHTYYKKLRHSQGRFGCRHDIQFRDSSPITTNIRHCFKTQRCRSVVGFRDTTLISIQFLLAALQPFFL